MTKFKSIAIISLALCLVLSGASTENAYAEGDKCGEEHVTDADIKIIKNATAVVNCVRGDTNQPSREWRAFKKLYLIKHLAKDSINTMLKNGSPAGKLYGAILLMQLDKPRATKELKRMSSSNKKVEYVFECEAEFTTQGALAKRILKGEELVKLPRTSN